MMKKAILIVAGLLVGVLCQAQRFSLGTNVVDYAHYGTLNLEGMLSVGKQWTLGAGVKYNPFLYRALEEVPLSARQRLFSLGTRFWPWHVYSGWWLGARGQWMEYNRGGIFSRSTEEGEAVGAGLSAGYTRMLHRNWNIEFGLGVWGGTTRYTTYACPTCGTVTDGGKKAFILPDDLMVSLIYIF
jgi:hypothetical protein